MKFDSLHFLFTLFAILMILGCCANSLIVIATIKTKNLHTSCNILIAFCAFSDFLHQLGQLPNIVMISLGQTKISSLTCSVLQIIPSFGLTSGLFLVLLIAIDRFISVYFPVFYKLKNARRYLGYHCLAIITYASMQYVFAFMYFEERNVICGPPEIYQGKAKALWGSLSFTVIILSVILYYAVWRKLKNTPSMANDHRLFRSILAIMGVLILGWLLTITMFVLVVFLLDWRDEMLFIGVEVAGIPVNSALTLNCAVLYITSREYRAAFRQQFQDLSCIKRISPLPRNSIAQIGMTR